MPREFYARRTLTVARELIGMHLVRNFRGKNLTGRIVEVEAYQGPQDLAAHSARGKTDRNAVMFGPPGFAYVYLIYGMWDCVNIVTREEGVPHAVLIRAVEPITNIKHKTWGPGLLCKAMRIDRSLNGTDLCGRTLWIETPENFNCSKIARAPRIGVDYAGDWAYKPWRFFDRDSPYVSTVSAATRRLALQSQRLQERD
ncbi:MAG TPA: DNA-3-methyladenine glycosylase [Steroidobacteraceae bacterium]|nr:DNA-3-methyladenine glycosylase [Steroidobacteraceae bacterium]